MKSITLTRGAGHTGAALAANVHRAHAIAKPHVAAVAAAAGVHAAHKRALPAWENTPLNLGHTQAAHASSGAGSSILRTFVALLVVVAVIYAVSWILRQFKRRGVAKASGNGLSQLATLPLGGNRAVTLVRAGNEVLLLGVAEQGVTRLRTYTEAEALAEGIELPQEEAPNFDPAERPFDRALDALRRITVRS